MEYKSYFITIELDKHQLFITDTIEDAEIEDFFNIDYGKEDIDEFVEALNRNSDCFYLTH